MSTGTGGTLVYAQADEDIFHTKLSSPAARRKSPLKRQATGSGGWITFDLELIKNLSNWQLVGKLGYGH